MSMRIFSAGLALLAIAACGSEQANDGQPTDPLVAAEEGARERQADSGMIPCAVNGAQEFRRDCAVDRTQSQDGLILTIRHSDGGFRRLLVTDDGRGVVAADGAEDAVVTPAGEDEIEVAIAQNRYRLPATVR